MNTCFFSSLPLQCDLIAMVKNIKCGIGQSWRSLSSLGWEQMDPNGLMALKALMGSTQLHNPMFSSNPTIFAPTNSPLLLEVLLWSKMLFNLFNNTRSTVLYNFQLLATFARFQGQTIFIHDINIGEIFMWNTLKLNLLKSVDKSWDANYCLYCFNLSLDITSSIVFVFYSTS